MSYYSDDFTDEKLAKLEQRIAAVYKQARDDLDKEVKDYFAKFEQRDAEMRYLVEAGEFSQEEYRQWRLTQIGRGERFETLRDKMAERFNHANEVALSYVNYLAPEIYCENRNFEAYRIEHQVGDCGFPYWDTASIPRLLVEEPDVMPYYPPERALRRGIDLAYGKSQITSRVTSGILRGLSPGKIAAELMQGITGMSRESALRAARTAITAAQNAGRMDGFVAAERIGVKIRRRWVCSKDLRTRDAHALADGQIVEGVDTPFEVGGEKLMFPGDTSQGASGWNIYNCRCGMRTVEKDGIEVEPRQMRVRDPITGKNELINEMTYQEWYTWKRAQDPAGFDLAKKKIQRESSDKRQFQKYQDEFGKNVPKTFADFQKLKYDSGNWEQFKTYATAIRTGELTPIASFNLYQRTSRAIDEKLVGITTANGIKVTGKSDHFISRVIGSIEQRRSGVKIGTVLEALTSEKSEVFPIKTAKNGSRSQKIRYKDVEVSVNPDTGILIQTNPAHRSGKNDSSK